MKQNLVKVKLHGVLAEQIEHKIFNLAVKTIGQTVNAIEILSKRKFYKQLLENDKKGIKYRVLINGRDFLCEKTPTLDDPESIVNSELYAKIHGLKTIDIVPVLEGAGMSNIGGIMLGVPFVNIDTGTASVIVGAMLIVLGVALLVFLGWTGIGGVVGVAAIIGGIGLIAAGVINLLSKGPELEEFTQRQKTSYLFSGPANTVNEGGPVPVHYGLNLIGSSTISASYDIKHLGELSGSTPPPGGDDGYSTTTEVTSTLNPSPFGNSITYTATVTSDSGIPTGNVTFSDDSGVLGTSSLVVGVATLTISTQSAGTHPVVASYSGDSTFASSEDNIDQVITSGGGGGGDCPVPNPPVFTLPATLDKSFSNSDFAGIQHYFAVIDGTQKIAIRGANSTLGCLDIIDFSGTPTLVAQFLMNAETGWFARAAIYDADSGLIVAAVSKSDGVTLDRIAFFNPTTGYVSSVALATSILENRGFTPGLMRGQNNRVYFYQSVDATSNVYIVNTSTQTIIETFAGLAYITAFSCSRNELYGQSSGHIYVYSADDGSVLRDYIIDVESFGTVAYADSIDRLVCCDNNNQVINVYDPLDGTLVDSFDFQTSLGEDIYFDNVFYNFKLDALVIPSQIDTTGFVAEQTGILVLNTDLSIVDFVITDSDDQFDSFPCVFDEDTGDIYSHVEPTTAPYDYPHVQIKPIT